jgi:hypothetical protein
MIALQNKLRQIGEAFAAVTENACHYFRPVTAFPALIWAEDGEADSFNADNHKACQNITGTVDLFTKTEFDPLLDDVQAALEGLGVAWRLESVQYEDETNAIHYEWTWEVATDGENASQGS